jgi:hypothetical protein
MSGAMKILLDTSVVIELLLDQAKANQVEQLLNELPLTDIHLSVFALDSIGVLFIRRAMHDPFIEFVDDWLAEGGMVLLALKLQDMRRVVEAARQFKLDFDDAHQHVVAEKYDLTLVSFDAHFDPTPRGRKSPIDLLSPS